MFYRAVVTSNQDPHKEGRVQVRYPHIEKAEEKPSEWASICLPYASGKSGMWFVPEVGDEVLVHLEGGDLEHPTVFGSLYNGTNQPPESKQGVEGNENGKNDLKYLRTRSGHLLSFNDSDDKKQVVLQDSEGSKLLLNATDKKLEIEDANKNKIAMESGKITIANSEGTTIVLEGGKLQIQSQNVEIAASQVKISNASSIELGSGASEALVKGQSFMALFNSHIHTATSWGAPTTPPMMQMTPAQLSTTVKTS